ncbi:MAG: RNA polymerase factor sigma-54 [Chthonomonadales bacterium]|nr:RNA polymerase factor sigma-54 [Chthonomonadales bacterium]
MLQRDQRQVMAQRIDPKLIMANAILQQSAIELAQHIEEELAENPALDAIEQEPACRGACVPPESCPICDQRERRAAAEEARYDGAYEVDPYARSAREEGFDPLGNLEAEVTLQDHLGVLLRAALPETDCRIGEYLISNLDDNGYLVDAPEEIADELNVAVEDVCRVLATIQSLDPPGVGARNLRECMLIQLQFLRDDGQGNAMAERMVRGHFEDVVYRRHSKLARALGISSETAKATIEYMRDNLNPYPASQFRPPWAYRPSNHRSSIRPDVVIRRTDVGYEVEVLGSEPFLLGVNPTYREAYHRARASNGSLPTEEKRHIVEYVERAELFIKHINQRKKTLRQITRAIVDLQQGFLETGSRAYLRPLTRTRIAEQLGMHESTISRATAKKYVQLPNQEVVPFDLLFNASLSIKTAIEHLIAQEDPAHPLSDQQIVELLREQGTRVARRTVVKYREAQKILSSNRRRR